MARWLPLYLVGVVLSSLLADFVWWWVDKVVREIPNFSATFVYVKDSPCFRDLLYVRAASRVIVVGKGGGGSKVVSKLVG